MRRDAREAVYRFIYSRLLSGEVDCELKEYFYKEHKLDGKDVEFANVLIDVVNENLDELTASVAELSVGFDIDRINYLDKSAMFIAMTEMKRFNDIDVAVSIDEALRLVRKYSSDSSISFVNGILAEYARRVR